MPGRPTNLDNSRARAYYACSRCGRDYLNIFLSSVFSFLFPSVCDTARNRLKYCAKSYLHTAM